MSHFEKALELFANKIPTHTEYINLVWRPHFGSFTADERKKFVFMCKFADAYHSTEKMIETGKYNPKISDSTYSEIFKKDGSLQGWLPDSVDSDALRAKLLKAKTEHEYKISQLIKEREEMVNAEIENIKVTINKLHKRLAALNLSYTEDLNSATFANHGDLVLTDRKTDKEYFFNYKD